MTMIQFREMATDDLVYIEPIASASFPTPWSVKTFWREIEQNERGHYWVLSMDQYWIDKEGTPRSGNLETGNTEAPFPQIMAYGGYWLMGEEAHIVTVATHPRWRQRGMGKLLLLYMLVEAAQSGAEVISLEVRESNQAAINLYKCLGFLEEGRRKEYYSIDKISPKREDALILTLANLKDTYPTQIARQHELVMSKLVQVGVSL